MKMINIILLSFMLLFSVPGFAGSVDINTADAETLSSELQGIGKKKASAIIEYRNANGKFNSIDELSRVKGISMKTIEKNRDKLTIDKSTS